MYTAVETDSNSPCALQRGDGEGGSQVFLTTFLCLEEGGPVMVLGWNSLVDLYSSCP